VNISVTHKGKIIGTNHSVNHFAAKSFQHNSRTAFDPTATMSDQLTDNLKRPLSEVLDENKMPKKRFFRTRAHCNPLSYNDGFAYPVAPDEFDWTALYPNIPEENRVVTVLDIGMGFGGLTVSLATSLPNNLVLGMEIRAKVSSFTLRKLLILL